MALSLDGATQYVSLGNGVNVISARSFTIAALLDRTLDQWGTIYSQGADAARGWMLQIARSTSGSGPNRLYFSMRTASGAVTGGSSSVAIPAGSGWTLVVAAVVDSGSDSTIYLQVYAYATATLTTTSVTVAGVDANAIAPDAGDPTVIGALNTTSGLIDYFGGDIGWVGIWGVDLTDGGQTGAGRVNELIHYGPDALNTTDCELLAVFDDPATDESDNARTLTLTGSPGYATTGVTYRAGRALAVSGSAATPSLTGSVTAVSLTGTVDSVAVTGS